MISDQDRSGYFGASDTHIMLSNTKTKTFGNWWLEKLGLRVNKISTVAMKAGTHYEHRILEAIGVTSYDKQFIIEKYKLRVNLDGDKDGCIYEVKTCKYGKPFVLPKKYKEQVQAQMFGSNMRKAKIIVYALKPNDYKNFFNPIDKDRLFTFDIEYDKKWIEEKYLPRLQYLALCLESGVFPDV